MNLKAPSCTTDALPLHETFQHLEPALQEALFQLHTAMILARDANCDAWEFAMEIDSLRRLNATCTQLRWLVCKGYIEHARETTKPDSANRTFESANALSFGSTSCFVLSEAGVLVTSEQKEPRRETRPSREDFTLPIWDADRRELRYQSKVIKRYRVPSPNQLVVLAAFDEEDWRCRIDDPLPPHPEIDPKRRLHDTIKSLNRHQIEPLLRFYGDGTGEGVRWGET